MKRIYLTESQYKRVLERHTINENEEQGRLIHPDVHQAVFWLFDGKDGVVPQLLNLYRQLFQNNNQQQGDREGEAQEKGGDNQQNDQTKQNDGEGTNQQGGSETSQNSSEQGEQPANGSNDGGQYKQMVDKIVDVITNLPPEKQVEIEKVSPILQNIKKALNLPDDQRQELEKKSPLLNAVTRSLNGFNPDNRFTPKGAGKGDVYGDGTTSSYTYWPSYGNSTSTNGYYGNSTSTDQVQTGQPQTEPEQGTKKTNTAKTNKSQKAQQLLDGYIKKVAEMNDAGELTPTAQKALSNLGVLSTGETGGNGAVYHKEGTSINQALGHFKETINSLVKNGQLSNEQAQEIYGKFNTTGGRRNLGDKNKGKTPPKQNVKRQNKNGTGEEPSIGDVKNNYLNNVEQLHAQGRISDEDYQKIMAKSGR